MKVRHRVGSRLARAVRNKRAGQALLNCTLPRSIAFGDGRSDTGTAGLGEEARTEANQASRRNNKFQANPARTMVGHGLHASLTLSHQLGDRTEVFLGDINGHTFHGLTAHTVNGLGDNLRLTNGEFEAFTAHLLNKNCQGEFTTSLNFPCVRTFGGQDSNGNVTDELAIQAILHLTRGHLGALDSSSHGRGVNTDRHRDRGIINGDQGQGARIVEVNQRLTDSDVFDTGYRNDIARLSGFGRKTLQAFGAKKLGDSNRLDRSVVASQTNGFALTQSAVVDTQQSEAAKEG